MADLSPVKRNVQVEETQFQFAVSESAQQKIGSSINFINNRQYDTKAFFMNGPYSLIGTGAQTGVDGLYVAPYDIEIHGHMMFNMVSGSLFTTEIDVHLLSSPGVDAGSIFSSVPFIDATSPNEAYTGSIRDDDGSIVQFGGGPWGGPGLLTSNPFNVDRGQALRVDFVQRMPDAENCGLVLYMRPR